MWFTLPTLPYDYDGLEPCIDAQTMQIHHSKHHQWYVDKLNAAIQDTQREDKPLEELLQSLPMIDEDIQTAVRNNAGWHRNHSFFWKLMTPNGKWMSENFKNIIQKNFGSIQNFQETFIAKAASNFGSGRTWLVKEHDELEIINTANQDNPLMKHKKAILGVDIREHAYYLKYQNKRPEYVENFFKVINWKKVNELYKEALE